MKEIPLSNNICALVDDEDYELLSQYNWYSERGYAVRKETINGKRINIRMHRQILGAPEGKDVDHINMIRYDNRKTNLRICSRSENICNVGKKKSNKSGYKGVFYVKALNKYRVQIKKGKLRIHVGYYLTALDAHIAYKEKAKEYFGDFARYE